MNATAPHKKLTSMTSGEWIHFEDAAKLLKVSHKTLTNYCSPKMQKIPAEAVRIGVTGKKFFNKNVLIGL